jgi:hypothetical protein
MANALFRRIAANDVVVVLSRYVGGTAPMAQRRFRCSHGAGMDPAAEGTGIWGAWAATGRSDRIESYMIDASALPTGEPDDVLRQLQGGSWVRP